MFEKKPVFTVSNFTRYLNESFRQGFQSVRIEGEVASFTRASSGHWYLTLKDENAQIKAVMFRQRNILVGFNPDMGDKLEVLAQLAVYEQRGELQLIVDTLKKAGQGSLYEQFLALKEKLGKEGLFDNSKKKPLPRFAFNVGVVTSLQAAALADIQKAFERRSPHVKYTVHHTPVQGDGAVPHIVKAIEQADACAYDVLILARGGGSLEDLWCFNHESVVRAVGACKTPVVVGVGHETDTTLAEFAADLRAATPTAAAELACKPTADLLDMLETRFYTLARVLQARFENLAQQVDRAELRLVTPAVYLNNLEQRVQVCSRQLDSFMQLGLSTEGRQLQRLETTMQNAFVRAQQVSGSQIDMLLRYLTGAKVRAFEQLQSNVNSLAAVVHAVSPQRTLEKGYAFLQLESTVASPDGAHVINSIDKVHLGQVLRATLADGSVLLDVLNKAHLSGESGEIPDHESI